MKRREFLKSTVVSAGALWLGVGCSSDGGGGGTDGGGSKDAGGGDLTGGGDAARDAGGGGLKPGEAFFPQSVASGDPTPGSVILWTRAWDPELDGQDLGVELEVARDDAFTQLVTLDGKGSRVLAAEARFDNCVKARVEGLDPDVTYWYRFIYTKGSERLVSRTGRTRTAPAPDSDVKVRFAFVSCQDYNGRFYNPYRRLLKEEIDFVVHLGDYVYETTGNPSFQDTAARRVVFRKPEEAIVFNEGADDEYFAARSLGNYRDLYRIYRSDEDLQRAHERFPFIATWDDHEFSDDCWGATATYFDGRVDETNVPRRKAANQAWFEYMPVDYMDAPAFSYDPKAAFPGDLRIWRDFLFGKHVHLVMTDERTYRSDHPVAEDAYPGAVILTQSEIEAALGSLPDSASPYADIDTLSGGLYAGVLKQAAQAESYPASKITGLVSVAWINAVVAKVNEGKDPADQVAPVSEADQAGMERGYAYLHLGKTGLYGVIGARFLGVKEIYALWSKLRFDKTGGASEVVLGGAQRGWFLDTMKGSDRTWKLWGNEFLLMSLTVDLQAFPQLPPSFKQKFDVLLEDWTGVPNRRNAILDELVKIPNVVALTGDVHAFFAGTPMVAGDPKRRIPEFVTAGISSAPLKTLLLRTALRDPDLAKAGAPALAAGIKGLLLDKSNKPSPHIAFAEPDAQGFSLVEAGADRIEVWFHVLPSKHATKNLGEGAALDGEFSTEHFKVETGSHELWRDFDGTWKRWDPELDDWASA